MRLTRLGGAREAGASAQSSARARRRSRRSPLLRLFRYHCFAFRKSVALRVGIHEMSRSEYVERTRDVSTQTAGLSVLLMAVVAGGAPAQSPSMDGVWRDVILMERPGGAERGQRQRSVPH